METMGSLRRTNYCGEVSMSNVGQEMTVCGSIARARDKGGIIFADLRDTTGILQLVFDEDTPKDVFAKAESLKSEYVVICRGLQPQCHFEHMSGKLGFGPHFQSAGTLKYLHVDLGTYYLNHLRHQLVSSGRDITNLILRYRSVDDEGHHVGYYATNSSFCCHIFLVVYFI